MLLAKLPITVLITAAFAGLSTASILNMRDFAAFDFALEKRQRGGKQGKGTGDNTAGGNNNQTGDTGVDTAAAQDDFCQGKTTTNGLQVKGGSCNDVVMGDMPANTKMTSTVILSPQPGQDLPADKTFTISLQVANLQAGSFSDPDKEYYTSPQTLNKQGQIIGHTHVTIQDMQGSLTPKAPLDASKFSFFKGINDNGDGKGGLTAVVTGGLPAGFYRICTLASSTTHQPVIMPVAQRGGQDDCTKFTVGQGKAGQNQGQTPDQTQGQNQGQKGQGKRKAARQFEA